MKNSFFSKRNIWIVFIIIILSSFSYAKFKIWRYSNPPDSRYINLFVKYTEIEFPSTGVIINKKILSGYNDGWEAAVIKVEDSTEFNQLKKKLYNKKFINIIPKKTKTTYFNSNITNNQGKFDSIINNYKDRFILVLIEKQQKIIFEKVW